jgi:hypothetical protein
MRIEFDWENIGGDAYRSRVIGGWVLLSYEKNTGNQSMVFIPDPNHEWEVA